MSMYASLIELMDPFLAISLPIMEKALALENNYEGMALNSPVPLEYSCDAFGHPKPFVSGLQQGQGSVLATSALLARTSEQTHRLLDAHQANASMEATILKMQKLWAPICSHREHFSCDEMNFWDIHYFSHAQTVALMEAATASALRAEIRQRLALNRRVKSFMSEHAEVFGEYLEQRKRNFSVVTNFLDFNTRSQASLETWKGYSAWTGGLFLA